jgi:hypothetical protein
MDTATTSTIILRCPTLPVAGRGAEKGCVVSGDTDGQEPPGDGWPRPCPWELIDVGEPTA